MSKLYKRISFALVFIITLLTASGCFDDESSSPTVNAGPVSLVTMPATSTARMIDESLYFGYLGAQRDFALIVDNASYTMDNNIQSCKDNGNGCASTLTKLVFNWGLKAANFTGIVGSENLLMYYTTAADFLDFGDPDNEKSWYSMMANTSDEAFESDSVKYHSCGTDQSEHSYVCDYAKDLDEKGYHNQVGNGMILLFDNGVLDSVLSDKDIDPEGIMNNKTNGYTRLDDLSVSSSSYDKINNYYHSLIKLLKPRINVSNASYVSPVSASKQKIQVLDTIQEVDDLMEGRVMNPKTGQPVKDFILLIMADGFILEKVGTNTYYDYDTGNPKQFNSSNPNGDLSELEQSSMQTASLLVNTVSAYVDNCAVESSVFLNFLKGLLRAMLAGTVGALAGAGAGAVAGAIVGSIFPGIGTAVGAAVGAILGAVAGLFAGIRINNKLEKKLKSANGISTTNYCKRVESALTNIQLNVPIYSYKIDSAKSNIAAFKNGKMEKEDKRLYDYYEANRRTCLTQYTKIAVPSGLSSFLTDNLDDEYNYADACQKELFQSTIGQFGGSPSLQLYLNGKLADDLFGRVTTDLVNEILNIWGLKDKGDVYTVVATSDVLGRDMSVTIGSMQEVDDLRYCISTSITPDCNNMYVLSSGNLETQSNYTDEKYINAIEKEDGISIEFSGAYMDLSKRETQNMINNWNLNGLKLNLDANSNGKYIYYYRNVDDSGDWNEINAFDSDNASKILEDVKRILTENNNGEIYQIGYEGTNYLICEECEGTTVVIGYYIDSHGNVVITYYNGYVVQEDETKVLSEYMFNNSATIDMSKNSEGEYIYDFNSDFYTIYARENEYSVDSAHDFYVYITYSLDDKELVYSYVV